MKIGLISINTHTKSLNFACPIHTWAFQQFLLQHGIESTVIDYIPNYNDDFQARDPVPYYEKKYNALRDKTFSSDEKRVEAEGKLRSYKEKLDGYRALRQERMIRYDKFQQFIADNYVMTDTTYTEDLLEIMDPGFDCYICVTDVIWSYNPFWGFDRGFFLDCGAMDYKWKIAYAASRGVPKPYTKEQKEYFSRALSDFNYIGVREESLKEYINENLPDHPATTVIDPVLLLNAKEYERVLIKPQETHYIVVYYAMERPKALLNVAVDYAKRHGCKIIELTHIPIEGGLVRSTEVEVSYRYDIGPGEWLGYIKYADCIFTNSFHAVCFSILFHKNFFTGKRNGDKLSHVIKLFGLEKQSISVTKNTDKKIHYWFVERRLRKLRAKSANFILSAIHDLEKRELPEKDYSYRKQIQYEVAYNSGKPNPVYTGPEVGEEEKLSVTASQNLEYRSYTELASNDGQSRLKPLMYQCSGYVFEGWYLRMRIQNGWFWVLRDGSIRPRESYDPSKHKEDALFEDEALIPYLSVNAIAVIVANGVWKEEQ